MLALRSSWVFPIWSGVLALPAEKSSSGIQVQRTVEAPGARVTSSMFSVEMLLWAIPHASMNTGSPVSTSNSMVPDTQSSGRLETYERAFRSRGFSVLFTTVKATFASLWAKSMVTLRTPFSSISSSSESSMGLATITSEISRWEVLFPPTWVNPPNWTPKRSRNSSFDST